METYETKTLTPYDLMERKGKEADSLGESVSLKSYDPFSNFSNWGNGPTNPRRVSTGLEKALK